MSSIKYFSTCSLSGEVTEDLSDQYFKIVVGHISSDLYFKICFLADLNELSLSETVRRLLSHAVSDVSFTNYDQPII